MIAEPYICTKGPMKGQIDWLSAGCGMRLSGGLNGGDENKWQAYADFEREKFRTLSRKWSSDTDGSNRNFLDFGVGTDDWMGYRFMDHDSRSLIGYDSNAYFDDSESSRLLKRAEFLKAVCEKEGVEWLPESELDRHRAETGMCRPHVDPDASSEGLYVGDMKPGEKRDIMIGGKKVGYIERSEGTAIIPHKFKDDSERDIVREVCAEKPKSGCEKCGSENTRFDFRYGCTPGLSFSGVECRECGHYKQHPPHYNAERAKEEIAAQDKRFSELSEAEREAARAFFKGEPERDTYSKAEIKHMLGSLCRMMIEVRPKFHRNPNVDQKGYWYKAICEVLLAIE